MILALPADDPSLRAPLIDTDRDAGAGAGGGVGVGVGVGVGASPDAFRLLVVDASELDFELLVATLANERMTIAAHRIETLGELQRCLEQARWDAVISDYRPQLTPIPELLQAIGQRDAAMPLIIVSDPIGEEAAVTAMRAGVDDCLIKGRLARLAPALLNAVSAAQQRRARARAAEALEDSERRLRELLAHLEDVVEQERIEIAREVHDDVGGMLTALRLDIGWIARHGDAASAERAGHAMETLAQVMLSAQRIQRNLRPPVLDAGLLEALNWQISEFRRRTGIDIRFESNVTSLKLEEDAAMTVYRTLQEALTNVSKHASASAVQVSLVSGAAEISLEISDDGVGLKPGALGKTTSFGLRGMAERARRMNGWVDVSPGASRGTCVLLSLPITPAAASPEPVPVPVPAGLAPALAPEASRS